MNNDFDNPKWTAYILGELSPEERAAVELELAASDEVRAFVHELQMAASSMKEQLHKEAVAQAVPGLSFAQRKAVREAAVPVGSPNGRRAWFAPFPLWTAGIATVAIVVGVAVWYSAEKPPQQIVQNTPEPPSRIETPPVTKNGGNTTKEQLPTPQAPPKATAPTPTSSIDRDRVIENSSGNVSGTTGTLREDGARLSDDTQKDDQKSGSDVRIRSSVDPGVAAPAPQPPANPAPPPPTLPLPAPIPIAPIGPPSASASVSASGSPSFGILGGVGPGAAGAGAAGGGGGARGGRGNPGGNNNGNNQASNSNNARGGAPAAARGGGGGGGRGGGGAAGGGQGAPLGGLTDLSNAFATENFAGQRGQAGQQGRTQAQTTAPAYPEVPLTRAPSPPAAPPPLPAAGSTAKSAVAGAALYTFTPYANNLPNAEAYDEVVDNPFTMVREPVALSIDVDTASYSNVRRFLSQSQLPPRAAVRIEELVNYFNYDYPFAKSDHPITANIEAAAAPWNTEHRLVRVGIRAKDAQIGEKPSNLVFLIDVSGSMEPAERLPLLKQGLRLLVQKLTENDRVTIVTYSGESGVALAPTNGSRKDVILAAIDRLRAEGSTNGGAGIQTAYDLAAANFIKGGVNRVVLMTDGDFNVGITNQAELIRLIEDKAKTGVFLSVLGVGVGNVKDSMMERLADRGNGLYAYIDSIDEARRVLVDRMAGTLIAVAKDVKISVEFNPAQVGAYRLIGYENRVMSAADFNDPRKDAGEMGAGDTVTALFEVVPAGMAVNTASNAGPLRYQQPAPAATTTLPAALAREMLNLKIKYKEPEGKEEKSIEFPLVDRGQTFANASADFRFAAAVAEFGMMLRESPYRSGSTWESVISIANGSRGADRDGYRDEFVRLAQRAELLWRASGR